MDTNRLNALADKVETVEPKGIRTLIAIAGAPASGKSWLAHALVEELNRRGAAAVAVPMDGFHLDNGILDARGLRARKGAPETFDGAGFVNAVRRLGREEDVVLPTFDRERDISIAGAIAIGAEDRIAVIEGNYLCFAEDPWNGLAPLWDLTCYLDVPVERLRERLIQRWLDFGHSREEAEARAVGNDLANAERIAGAQARIDVLLD